MEKNNWRVEGNVKVGAEFDDTLKMVPVEGLADSMPENAPKCTDTNKVEKGQ